MLWSVNYYDDEGRVTKSIVQHYKGGTLSEGNYDETDNTYSFTDELLTSTRHHKVNSTEQVKIFTLYEYDHMGRKVNTWETIGSGDTVLLAQNTYNEIGQLKEKRLHSKDKGNTFLQKIAYQYNERGWLKQINDPGSLSAERVFGMNLQYNDHADATRKQYNGNISSLSWQTKVPASSGFPQEKQSYDYTYDKLNRLELAAYTTPGKTGYFNEQLSYDKAGNIQSLDRTSNGTGKTDQLSYSYDESGQSNRLASLTDGSSSNEGQPAGTTNYTYDDNGNLASDSKKQLTVSYNELNLPKTVAQTGSNQTITYLYDASGRKLRKEATGGNRDYIGGIEYGNDGQIEFIQTEEGRAVKSGENYSYEYMLKDHLGNTRAVVKQDGSIIQLSDYYAFGMEMNHNGMTPSPDNRYKYNGKELQTELGMNQYDYGARFYDPVIGRWNVIDRFSEKYHSLSTYQYGANNPIKNIDVNGDSINVSLMQRYDTNNKTSHVSTTLTDLQSQTGLSLSVDANGQLSYLKDPTSGAPFVNVTSGQGGNTLVEAGSSEARNLIVSAIDNTSTAYARITTGGSSAAVGGNMVNINPTQINSFINGATNVDSRTLGFGMTFMHELIHSGFGGGLTDPPTSAGFGPTGATVDKMNVIRSELNNNGGNYGQRSSYQAIGLTSRGPAYLPFNPGASSNLQRGIVPAATDMYIKF
ncbi:hypothetical protein DDR33_24635 [Pararcticibacter amylolyticus]|uniref:RHS repeat-associated core domain-containing protein n=2 Tax=Pararcticibacter amylolyticus TaxID=2173175 RepID=A0A2U2P9B9_9SPHI|nr:hypothetical protein DDR33_24635 [Pararcticibacter amylolyticus]